MFLAIARTVLFGFLLLHASTAAAGDRWLSNLDEAKRLAARNGKDLFILFTGTAWCAPCVQFESNVLSRAEFPACTEPFILVKLEFPKSDEELPAPQRKDFIAWREQYGIRTFPTVILDDPTGRPYALTGHIGLGAEDYARHLGKLRDAHDRRDKALLIASKSHGVKKARLLEAALSAVASVSDESYAQERTTIKQLGRIDEMAAVYDRLIDEVIDDHATAWRFLRDKAEYLTGADRPAEALKAWEASRRLVDEGTDNWLDTEVFRARLLARLGKPAEAIAAFDSALNVKSLTTLHRANLLAEKAMVLSKAGRREEALACAEQTEEILKVIEANGDNETVTKFIRYKLRVARNNDGVTYRRP